MENIRDWCISRQLWFGHRIPAYYVALAGEPAAAPGGPSERMDRWVIAASPEQARQLAEARFPGQQLTLQQVPGTVTALEILKAKRDKIGLYK